MMVDLCFPVLGDVLKAECYYAWYAALSRAAPAFHDRNEQVQFALVGGIGEGKGLLRLTPSSRLRVRLPVDRIGLALPLSGKVLQVGEHSVVLGAPTVRALEPAPVLFARLVTFKNAIEPERFLEVARERLGGRGIRAEPVIPVLVGGPRAGEPRRRVLRIKGKTVVGYSLVVEGLSAEDSIRLQEETISGRARLGCGFFLPFRGGVMHEQA
jgi:CRISPR-associated endonuclease/helicase Cas3